MSEALLGTQVILLVLLCSGSMPHTTILSVKGICACVKTTVCHFQFYFIFFNGFVCESVLSVRGYMDDLMLVALDDPVFSVYLPISGKMHDITEML